MMFTLVAAGTVIPLALAALITLYVVRRKQRKERENADHDTNAPAV